MENKFLGTGLKGETFEKTEFKNINLINYTFDDCTFDECTFEGCVFSAVKFNNCKLYDVSISKSKFVGIDWTKVNDIARLKISESVLDLSNFGFLKLTKIKMTNCSIRECDFTETNLESSDFGGSDFENTRFFKTNLNKCDFVGAKNYLINVYGNKILKAKFSMPEAFDLLKCLDIVIE